MGRSYVLVMAALGYINWTCNVTRGSLLASQGNHHAVSGRNFVKTFLTKGWLVLSKPDDFTKRCNVELRFDSNLSITQ